MWRPRFAESNDSPAYYDLIGDYELVEASFAQQYGIRLRYESGMTWDEFTTLLAGINGDTPLGRIVSIRSENDKERLKHFTPEERRIRNEWRSKHRKVITDQGEINRAFAGFGAILKSIGKEEKHGE